MNSEIGAVLKSISEPFDCVCDGNFYQFESGEIAVGALKSVLKASHGIKCIGTQNGKMNVTIVDRQSEIDENNRVWMTEEEKRTGVAPSFF